MKVSKVRIYIVLRKGVHFLASGLLLTLLSGCSPFLSGNSALPNALLPQTTPTYDGSGQATEPSVHFFPDAWNGFRYWLVVNPYPYNEASKENPSILVSNDGASWRVPPGLTDPIALPSIGHLADGDLFYDSDANQLWVYYLWEDDSANTHVLRKTSSNGLDWTDPEDLIAVPNYVLQCPTVAKVGSQYHMWAINAGTTGCNAKTTSVEYRTSNDGLNWSAPQTTDLSQPAYTIWHIEVIDVPSRGELWMLSAAYPAGANCGSTVLFFARSTDGVHWTSFKNVALGRGSSWDRGEIYRSTGVYDENRDLFRVWYSAQTHSVWHIGYTEENYSEFLLRIAE